MLSARQKVLINQCKAVCVNGSENGTCECISRADCKLSEREINQIHDDEDWQKINLNNFRAWQDANNPPSVTS